MAYFIIIALVFLISLLYSFFSIRKANKKNREYFAKSFGQLPSIRTNIESAATYYQTQQPSLANSSVIDDITWNDLDMDEVFHRINVCQTSIGEEMLYKVLRVPAPIDPDFEKWMRALRQNKEKRLDIQCILSQLGKTPYSGLSHFLAGTTLVQTLSRPLLLCMSFLPLIALVSMIFIGFSGLILAIIAAVVNLAYAFSFKQKLTSSLTAIRTMSSMLWCAEKLSNIELEGFERPLSEIKSLYQLFKPLKSRFSNLSSETMSANNMAAMGEFATLMLLSDVRRYQKSAALLLGNKEKAMCLYEKVGYLDMLVSVCSFRKSLGAVCAPTFHDEMSVSMERMGHPLLSRPVENDFQLMRDTLITGSNASGKSTFIKAVAINALLAQSIHTCAAKSFSLPHTLVISSMALKDSIVKGDSYFIAEIKSLLRIMEASRTQPCLCFVDEILRGTNTVERIAASAAVLYSLSQENCLCLVASHDIELTRILQNEYDNYHFEESISDSGVSFDYLIKAGPSQTRNAIVLLSTMGFDKRIIDEAHALVTAFETTNTWPSFHQED